MVVRGSSLVFGGSSSSSGVVLGNRIKYLDPKGGSSVVQVVPENGPLPATEDIFCRCISGGRRLDPKRETLRSNPYV